MNTQKQIRNYTVRQRNWVRANNLKIGDIVLVRKSHLSHDKGWNNSWVPEMNYAVGKKYRVTNLGIAIGIELGNEGYFWVFPYTVLQKI